MRSARSFAIMVAGALALALICAGCCSGSPSAATQSPPASAASPTLTTSPHSDWRSYQDAQFGFQIDVPAALSATGAPADANASDMGFSYPFDLGTPMPAQAPFAPLRIEIAATSANYLPVCNVLGKGRPITIGSGLPGFQQDNLNATPVPNASNAPTVTASLVTGGVGILITMSGDDPKDTFLDRYGAVWQHMLASFVPGPSVPNGHPCG